MNEYNRKSYSHLYSPNISVLRFFPETGVAVKDSSSQSKDIFSIESCNPLPFNSTIETHIKDKNTIKNKGESDLDYKKIDLLTKKISPIGNKFNMNSSVESIIKMILLTCEIFEVKSDYHISYILATASHESSLGKNMIEDIDGKIYEPVFDKNSKRIVDNEKQAQANDNKILSSNLKVAKIIIKRFVKIIQQICLTKQAISRKELDELNAIINKYLKQYEGDNLNEWLKIIADFNKEVSDLSSEYFIDKLYELLIKFYAIPLNEINDSSIVKVIKDISESKISDSLEELYPFKSSYEKLIKISTAKSKISSKDYLSITDEIIKLKLFDIPTFGNLIIKFNAIVNSTVLNNQINKNLIILFKACSLLISFHWLIIRIHKATNLGNNKVGDGEKYKGRGLTQLTGRYLYNKFDKIFNLKNSIYAKAYAILNNDSELLQLLKKPDLVNKIEVSAPIIVGGMKEGRFRKPELKLSKYDEKNGYNFYFAREIINPVNLKDKSSINKATKIENDASKIEKSAKLYFQVIASK